MLPFYCPPLHGHDRPKPKTHAGLVSGGHITQVLPFFEEQGVSILRVPTDRGPEYCGRLDTHPYQLHLQQNEIEHTKTRARRPQTSGICERFHRTDQDESCKVAFRRKIYSTLEALHADLDAFMVKYNERRTHQGKRCQGRTPMQAFLDSKQLAQEKQIAQRRPKTGNLSTQIVITTSSFVVSMKDLSRSPRCWSD